MESGKTPDIIEFAEKYLGCSLYDYQKALLTVLSKYPYIYIGRCSGKKLSLEILREYEKIKSQ